MTRRPWRFWAVIRCLTITTLSISTLCGIWTRPTSLGRWRSDRRRRKRWRRWIFILRLPLPEQILSRTGSIKVSVKGQSVWDLRWSRRIGYVNTGKSICNDEIEGSLYNAATVKGSHKLIFVSERRCIGLSCSCPQPAASFRGRIRGIGVERDVEAGKGRALLLYAFWHNALCVYDRRRVWAGERDSHWWCPYGFPGDQDQAEAGDLHPGIYAVKYGSVRRTDPEYVLWQAALPGRQGGDPRGTLRQAGKPSGGFQGTGAVSAESGSAYEPGSEWERRAHRQPEASFAAAWHYRGGIEQGNHIYGIAGGEIRS